MNDTSNHPVQDAPGGPPIPVTTAGPSGGNAPRPQFYIPLAKPVISRIIMGVLLAVFVAEIIYGIARYNTWMSFTDTDIHVLVDMGAKVNVLIAAGDFWRLFTAMLLHDGIIHLLFNLYALFALGPLLEAYVGPARFLAIYVLGGLFGSLLSYALSSSPSVGASGAIFGIIGATTVYFFRYRHNLGPQGRAILQNMVVVIIINLVFGFTAGFIDNWGHIGGLIGGAIVAVGLVPQYKAPDAVVAGDQPLQEVNRRGLEIAWVVGCTLVFVAGVWLTNMRYADQAAQLLR